MKKIICTILVFAMAFSLAACSSQTEVQPSETPVESQLVESEDPSSKAPANSETPEAEEVPAQSEEVPAQSEAPAEPEPEKAPAVGENILRYTSGYIAPGMEVLVFDHDCATSSETITLPYINLGSKDSQDVNRQMEELYDELSASGGSAAYVYAQSETILSVAVSAGKEVTAYNFNIADGLLIKPSELITEAGFDVETVTAAYEQQCIAYFTLCESYYETDMSAEDMVDEAVNMFKSELESEALTVYSDFDGNLCLFPFRRDLASGDGMAQVGYDYNDSVLLRAVYNAPAEAMYAIVNDPQGWDAEDAVFTCTVDEGDTAMFVALSDGTEIAVNGAEFDEDAADVVVQSGRIYANAVELDAGDTFILQATRAETIPSVAATVTCGDKSNVYYMTLNGRWGTMPIEYIAAD